MNKKTFNYNSTKSIVCRVFRDYARPNAMSFLVAVAFMLVSAACVSCRAYLMKPAIDQVFVKSDMRALYLIPIKIVAVAIISCIAVYIQGLLMSITNQKISMKLQETLFKKLIYNDIGFYQKHSAAEIFAYFGDASGIGEIINLMLNGLILQSLTLVALVGLMLFQNFKLSLVSFIAFPTIILPLSKIGKKVRNLSNRNREKVLDISSIINESFLNIQVVKSNSREDIEIEKTKNKLSEIYNISTRIAKKSLLV
ncbi:MAG: hypothetical protein LBS34_01880, partial [Rickettsiales bacterium]|nr:hypothetical protein [Rickettsiales bacterium]